MTTTENVLAASRKLHGAITEAGKIRDEVQGNVERLAADRDLSHDGRLRKTSELRAAAQVQIKDGPLKAAKEAQLVLKEAAPFHTRAAFRRSWPHDPDPGRSAMIESNLRARFARATGEELATAAQQAANQRVPADHAALHLIEVELRERSGRKDLAHLKIADEHRQAIGRAIHSAPFEERLQVAMDACERADQLLLDVVTIDQETVSGRPNLVRKITRALREGGAAAQGQ